MTDVRELIERLLEMADEHRAAADALTAALEREEALRVALERAAMRLDMMAPLIIENKSAFDVTKWANEARAAAWGKGTGHEG